MQQLIMQTLMSYSLSSIMSNTLTLSFAEHRFEKSKVVVKDPGVSESLELEDLPHIAQMSTSEKDWTYERLRDSLGVFNNGFFDYADRLSTQIKANFVFKSKYLTCSDNVNKKLLEKRHVIQEKVNLQQTLQDLQAKYNAYEQALEKLEDINDDNKEVISRLRAHRDRCVQNHANRKKTIDSLRDEATELRRQITRARSQLG